MGNSVHSDNANILSGSTNGRPISIAATSSPGTLIHQSINQAGINIGHQLHLHAINSDSSDHILTLQLGGVTATDDLSIVIKANSQVQEILNGNNLFQNGVVIRGYADSANKILVYGYINIYARPNSKPNG